MSDVFPSIPFDEAVAALKRRGLNLAPSGHWATVWQEAHHTAFTVARSAGFDILGDIHAGLMRVLEEGRTFDDFKKDLVPLLQRRGWWGRATVADPDTGEVKNVQLGSVRRLRTIYDVNMRVSAAQGRWEQQQRTKDAFQYLRYVGILDSKIRPRHRLWHGTILPIDHPWWKTHYPPNGWHCRCEAVSVSEDDCKRYGWKPAGAAPDGGETEWVNPATGETTLVPDGIDPGFAYNPGNTDQAARAAKLAMDKLVDMPPELGAAAAADMAFAFPQVEREFREWAAPYFKKMENGIYQDKNEHRVIGALTDKQITLLRSMGVTTDSAAIVLYDKDMSHFWRTEKEFPIPASVWMRLPELIRKPDAVYWDKQKPGLIYVITLPEGNGKIIILLDRTEKINRKKHKINKVRTGRTIKDTDDFKNTTRYTKIV